MTDIRQAQRAFDAGVLSLGLTIDGQESPRDLTYAKLAFLRATEWDPGMCDAWLGRATTGEVTSEVLFNLHKTSRTTLFREQRRLGLQRGELGGRFSPGLYIDYPLTDFTQIWLAQAAQLISEREYDEAEQLLNELAHHRVSGAVQSVDREAEDRICAYVRGVLHFTTQRWPDVMSNLAGSAEWDDEYLATGAHVMVGSACAQLGLFGEAIRRLELAEAGPLSSARIDAMFCRGLSLRETGHEDDARSVFEQLYSQEPNFEANAKALRDPKFRLVVTTKELIEARTDRWDPASTPSQDDLDRQDLGEKAAEILAAARAELDRQIGLESVKTQVAKLQSSATLAKVRADKGMASSPRSLHLAFTGPPGTGKTTIARVVAKIYCGLGLLKTDNVVEVKRQDFVGQHLGSTAIKTTKLIDSAMDGVLFIDEAYTLIQTGLSGGDAFGREAVDTLLARMENDRDRLVVIIAGYDGEIDRFLAANDGLASRFAKRVRFDSYAPEELGQIGKVIATARDSDISDDALALLIEACRPLYAQERIDQSGAPRRGIDLAGNGRFIRNVVETAEEEREYRLTADDSIDLTTLDEHTLMRIEAVDMRNALESVLGMLSTAQ